jgi:hypothetical protein
MGQDTYAYNGVYVVIKFNYKNLNLIKKMLEEKIHIYFQTNINCNDDEIMDLDGLDNYKEILNSKSNKEFKLLFKNDKTIQENQELFCLNQVFESYARNISRRENNHIFNDMDIKFNQLIKKFKEARNKFIELGFSKKNIKCGYSFADSF